MSLSVLVEQKSSKTRKQLKSDGWSSAKPGDFSRDTYDVVESSDGFLMYKSKGVSTTPPPPSDAGQTTDTPTQETTVTTSPYEKWATVFKFTTQDNKEVAIRLDNELKSAIEKFKTAGFDDDDAFVRAVVETYPKVTYIFFLKGTADIKESVIENGLTKVLSEQEYQTITVIRDPNSPNFKLTKGKLQISDVSNRPAVPAQQKPVQTAEPQPEAKPEGEELLKKEQEAVTAAEKDETEGDKLFTTIQKRYVNQYNQEGWTTEKPLQNLSGLTETMNLKEKHPEVFKEDLKMYRAKTNTPDGLKRWAEEVGQGAIQDRMLTRGGCRTNIKVYFDLAKQNIEIGEEKLDNLANIVLRCQDKFENFNDFGLTKKRIYDLGNQQGERKRFKLNYSSNTRG